MNEKEYETDIREGIIDKIQMIFEQSKIELQKVQCETHGQALKDLQFDRANGRFKFDTCCSKGNDLVEDAIKRL